MTVQAEITTVARTTPTTTARPSNFWSALVAHIRDRGVAGVLEDVARPGHDRAAQLGQAIYR